MKLITDFRLSKHKPGRSPFVGPRTFTTGRRRWQIRVVVDMPFEPGATERPVVSITMDTSVMGYSQAAVVARDQLELALRDNPEWTDFSWQVYAKN